MRWLFLLLLLANAGYFAWQALKAPMPEPTRSTAPAAQGLALLSELSEGEHPALRAATPPPTVEPEEEVTAEERIESVAVEPEVQPEPEPPRQCLELKGFEKPSEAESLLKAMLGEGMQLEARGDELVPRSNYWVLIPPFKTRAEAEVVIKQLKGRKLRDFYRVRSGESANAISLGVFSSKDAAERRYRQVVNLGLKTPKPRIKVLELQAKRHWLRLSYQAQEPPQWRDLLEKSEGIQSREWQCEESR